MVLNINNVEDLIFLDRNVRKLLPRHKTFFDQWTLAYITPGMKGLGRRTVFSFLNELSDDDIKVLEGYFKDKVEVTRLNANLVETYKFPLENAKDGLDGMMPGNLSLYRDERHLYVCAWR